MAPEQFDDDGTGYTTAVDVYACSMFLYELCTTARPFRERGQLNAFTLATYVMQGQRPTIPGDVLNAYR
jgi:serine/threonine protein kinase